MKIKDIKGPLGGVVFLHPETRERCIWASQWDKGVWYKKNNRSDTVFPLFLANLTDALEFDLAPARSTQPTRGLKDEK